MRSDVSNSANLLDNNVLTFRFTLKEEGKSRSSACVSNFNTRRLSVSVKCWNSHRFAARFTLGRTCWASSPIDMHNSLKSGRGRSVPATAQIYYRRITLERSARLRNSINFPRCCGERGVCSPCIDSPDCSAAICKRLLRRCSPLQRPSAIYIKRAYCDSTL